jgi:HK97 family phage prohead protease
MAFEQPEAIRAMNSTPSSENPRLLKQYFAIWNVKDDLGCIPIKGCFKKSIEERGPNTNSTFKIVVLWCHDQRDPLCIPTVLKEDEIGLYAEYVPDPVPSGDRCVTQVRSGTINQGSYGFNYVWDKMEWDDNLEGIIMKEANLFEISPVSIASQRETFAVRNADGTYTDPYLDEETEELIKLVPRKHQLEIRSLIDRHISLAKAQPLELRQKTLGESKPKQVGIDYTALANRFSL